MLTRRQARLVEVVWAQEEPRNMGDFTFVEPRLRSLLERTSACASLLTVAAFSSFEIFTQSRFLELTFNCLVM